MVQKQVGQDLDINVAQIVHFAVYFREIDSGYDQPRRLHDVLEEPDIDRDFPFGGKYQFMVVQLC